jgi:hypothetical protein
MILLIPLSAKLLCNQFIRIFAESQWTPPILAAISIFFENAEKPD